MVSKDILSDITLSLSLSLSLSLLGLKGDCNISMKDDDFMDMATGKLNGQKVI